MARKFLMSPVQVSLILVLVIGPQLWKQGVQSFTVLISMAGSIEPMCTLWGSLTVVVCMKSLRVLPINVVDVLSWTGLRSRMLSAKANEVLLPVNLWLTSSRPIRFTSPLRRFRVKSRVLTLVRGVKAMPLVV